MLAIILAGGFGTRLQAVLNDLPKPMAPIHDKPFLAHLLHYLKSQGITQVIFSTHYLSEKIQNYFQSEFDGIEIQYAHEDKPLGTGGAIVNALTKVADKNKPVFVLNGDTFLKMNYREMYAAHQHANITMALRQINDCSRYGKVLVENNKVKAFQEKGEHGEGLINAGVYLIQPNLFSNFNLPAQFSLEQDFLFVYLAQLSPHAFITNDYFIDIGIPEDYARAQRDLM